MTRTTTHPAIAMLADATGYPARTLTRWYNEGYLPDADAVPLDDDGHADRSHPHTATLLHQMERTATAIAQWYDLTRPDTRGHDHATITRRELAAYLPDGTVTQLQAEGLLLPLPTPLHPDAAPTDAHGYPVITPDTRYYRDDVAPWLPTNSDLPPGLAAVADERIRTAYRWPLLPVHEYYHPCRPPRDERLTLTPVPRAYTVTSRYKADAALGERRLVCPWAWLDFLPASTQHGLPASTQHGLPDGTPPLTTPPDDYAALLHALYGDATPMSGTTTDGTPAPHTHQWFIRVHPGHAPGVIDGMVIDTRHDTITARPPAHTTAAIATAAPTWRGTWHTATSRSQTTACLTLVTDTGAMVRGYAMVRRPDAHAAALTRALHNIGMQCPPMPTTAAATALITDWLNTP